MSNFKRYVRAKWGESQKDLAYRFYVTDCLYYQGQGKCLSQRFADLVIPQKEDSRTGDEIALDVISKLGLKIGGD